MKYSVLLDTSFFIRLLNDEDDLHQNAKGYFRYFLQNQIVLKVSTISIAEYCVRGVIDELPLNKVQVLPFNLSEAKKTGVFARELFNDRKINPSSLSPRAIIPNDAKLFAQADTDAQIEYFVTSDKRSDRTYSALSKSIKPQFKIIDISTPYSETFGELEL